MRLSLLPLAGLILGITQKLKCWNFLFGILEPVFRQKWLKRYLNVLGKRIVPSPDLTMEPGWVWPFPKLSLKILEAGFGVNLSRAGDQLSFSHGRMWISIQTYKPSCISYTQFSVFYSHNPLIILLSSGIKLNLCQKEPFPLLLRASSPSANPLP